MMVMDISRMHSDPDLPTLTSALNIKVMHYAFQLASVENPPYSGKLISIRILRYKPGRRCVIEYSLEGIRDAPAMVIVGKVRRLRSGRGAYELMQAFRRHGFDGESTDNISVPEPAFYLNPLRMWFQRKVEGVEATRLLVGERGIQLGRKVAEAAFKIHKADVITRRTHLMDDELRILQARLSQVMLSQPQLKARLQWLMNCAIHIGSSLESSRLCGIHRDFYSDQVIVDGERIWLLDFDLYCKGDPGLDIGNFIAHVTEQSLRETGNIATLGAVERAIEQRYVELAGVDVLPSIRAYTLLTLMRHIYISTLHDERRSTTEALLSLCEARALEEIGALSV